MTPHNTPSLAPIASRWEPPGRGEQRERNSPRKSRTEAAEELSAKVLDSGRSWQAHRRKFRAGSRSWANTLKSPGTPENPS